MRKLIDLPIAPTVEKLFLRGSETTPLEDYHGLFTLFAMAKGAVATGNDNWLAKCKEYLDKYPNEIEHPKYSFDLYEIGGIAKSYLFYNGEYGANAEEIREYAEKTHLALRTSDGIICYKYYKKTVPHKWIWVDAITAVAPFMLYAGLALQEPRYVDFAAEQTIRMFDALLDPECGLVHQSRGRYEEDANRCSEDHWSRGNGWMMVAFAELLEFLPQSSPFYKDVVSRYQDFCESLIRYQSIRGLWRQEITVEGAWEESSGTGLITYGLGVGIRLGILTDEKYKKAFDAALCGLANYCISENYHTYLSCEGNNFPGRGDQRGTIYSYICIPKAFRNEPHSFGCIMLALIEALKNGYVSIKKYNQVMYTNEEPRPQE